MYFLRSSLTNGCAWRLWEVPLPGRGATMVRGAGSTPVMAVSPDGSMLAYLTGRLSCTASFIPSKLVVVNLRADRVHEVKLFLSVQSIGWSYNDRSVVLEGYSGMRSGPGALVLPNVETLASVGRGASAPCPLGAPYCGEMSPQYDAQGDLFYIAAIDPNFQRPCAQYACTTQAYVLTEVRDGRPHVLYRTVGRAREEAWMSVSSSGGTVVFTLPMGGSTERTLIWSREYGLGAECSRAQLRCPKRACNRVSRETSNGGCSA